MLCRYFVLHIFSVHLPTHILFSSSSWKKIICLVMGFFYALGLYKFSDFFSLKLTGTCLLFVSFFFTTKNEFLCQKCFQNEPVIIITIIICIYTLAVFYTCSKTKKLKLDITHFYCQNRKEPRSFMVVLMFGRKKFQKFSKLASSWSSSLLISFNSLFPSFWFWWCVFVCRLFHNNFLFCNFKCLNKEIITVLLLLLLLCC